jgi:hypothetical protein
LKTQTKNQFLFDAKMFENESDKRAVGSIIRNARRPEGRGIHLSSLPKKNFKTFLQFTNN